MDEILVQIGNYVRVTGKEPDTLIINDMLFTKYLLESARYVHIEIDDVADDFRIYGLKVIKTHDIKGFKVTRLNI